MTAVVAKYLNIPAGFEILINQYYIILTSDTK